MGHPVLLIATSVTVINGAINIVDVSRKDMVVQKRLEFYAGLCFR